MCVRDVLSFAERFIEQEMDIGSFYFSTNVGRIVGFVNIKHDQRKNI